MLSREDIEKLLFSLVSATLNSYPELSPPDGSCTITARYQKSTVEGGPDIVHIEITTDSHGKRTQTDFIFRLGVVSEEDAPLIPDNLKWPEQPIQGSRATYHTISSKFSLN